MAAAMPLGSSMAAPPSAARRVSLAPAAPASHRRRFAFSGSKGHGSSAESNASPKASGTGPDAIVAVRLPIRDAKWSRARGFPSKVPARLAPERGLRNNEAGRIREVRKERGERFLQSKRDAQRSLHLDRFDR